MKIYGADPDFHRRDLFEAIAKGAFPEWELSIQAFDQKTADKLPFDMLDPTKLIPRGGHLPWIQSARWSSIGTPTTSSRKRNRSRSTPATSYRVSTSTNDPLLQGRLFSYLDTQLIRLGGPNFYELPINRPKCPMRNFQRDGFMQMEVPKGRVSYEPNSLDPKGPRELPGGGFTTFAEPLAGAKERVRPESFADHYSQARMFFRSMMPPEQRHIVSAFAFELGKVETPTIRRRMLGHLIIVDKALGDGVAQALGMDGQAEKMQPAQAPIDLPPSPALSLIGKAEKTLQGRKVAILVGDGSDRSLVAAFRAALKKEGAELAVVALKIGGAHGEGGQMIAADHALASAPSTLFDAVVLAPSSETAALLTEEPAAVDWVRDAFRHLKVIGHVAAAARLLNGAGVEPDAGIVALDGARSIATFIAAAKTARIWDREDLSRR